MILDTKSSASFITKVSTISKESNILVTTKLKVVLKDGFYFITRRNKNSKWYNNLLVNNYAEIEINGEKRIAIAEEMVDEEEKKEVSAIKYSDERKEENRFGFKLRVKEV
ncbi:nitroreductase family deazaflavin-dependent oxidoreductase [bacterium]|nr:nitroreductase family deazaflavin-dependent oxidoreductase [bacterium]|tara:strand:- start:16422 stop:16751 length:330 start_codon:yes stop_codon:yes gene_type:complete